MFEDTRRELRNRYFAIRDIVRYIKWKILKMDPEKVFKINK